MTLDSMIGEIRKHLPEARRKAAGLLIEQMKGHNWGDTEHAEELMHVFLAAAVQCLRLMPYGEEETGRRLNVALAMTFFFDTSDDERDEIKKRLAEEIGPERLKT